MVTSVRVIQHQTIHVTFFVYSSTTLEANKVIVHGSRGRHIHGRTWEEATNERHDS